MIELIQSERIAAHQNIVPVIGAWSTMHVDDLLSQCCTTFQSLLAGQIILICLTHRPLHRAVSPSSCTWHQTIKSPQATAFLHKKSSPGQKCVAVVSAWVWGAYMGIHCELLKVMLVRGKGVRMRNEKWGLTIAWMTSSTPRWAFRLCSWSALIRRILSSSSNPYTGDTAIKLVFHVQTCSDKHLRGGEEIFN